MLSNPANSSRRPETPVQELAELHTMMVFLSLTMGRKNAFILLRGLLHNSRLLCWYPVVVFSMEIFLLILFRMKAELFTVTLEHPVQSILPGTLAFQA